MIVGVERLPEPIRVPDMYDEMIWSTVYGYLHLGDNMIPLDQIEDVEALEILLAVVWAADSYRQILPQGEHMALAPGSRSRALAAAVDKMRGFFSLSNEETNSQV